MFAGKHRVMKNSWVGKIGEDTVAKYLTSKKYKIVERNFRTKFGEIDLIAKDSIGTLVLIEVKTLIAPSPTSLKPEDNLTDVKLRKFRRVSQYYASLYPEYINEKLGFRLDVVVLQCPNAEALNNPLQFCDIRHYENII
jgi:putative endonuclease